MSKPAKSNAAKTTQFVKKANGGSASSAKSGVNRLKQSEAYPKMPRFQDGGEASNDEFIQQMMVGTPPADQEPSPADVRASKMLRALGEVARGTVGAEALEQGSEAYRTGQALANMPGVGIAVGTAKGVGKAGGKLSELEKRVLRSQGAEGAKRVQRAADEIKNLEDQFSLDALELAFQGRKGSPYQGVMTVKPGDFEKFAARLDERAPSLNRRVEDLQWVLRDAADKNLSESRRALMGFSDVPYLRADVEPGKLARITGHEGRHRTRAMTAENMPTTLVELLPQSGLEFRGQLPMPGTSPAQWRDEVNKLFSKGVVAEKEKRLAPEVAELMFQKAQLERSSSPDWGKIRAIEEELDLWRQSGKYFLEDPTMVREMPQVYANGGDVSTDDWIQQMLTGTPPADQEPGFIGKGIRAAGTQLYENLREAVQDPKAFHKRALGNIATRLQEDPEGFAMDWTGGGLSGIVKPKGGIFPKEGSGSKLDTYLERIQEYVPQENRERTIGDVNAITDFIRKKARKYFTSVYGAADDPLREALLEGRLPRMGSDKERFRDYLMTPAREGTDPIARQDFERFYDEALSLDPILINRTEDWRTGAGIRETAARKMMDQMRAEGVPEELVNQRYFNILTPERLSGDYAPGYQQNLARQIQNETLGLNRPIDIDDQTLFRAAREGETIYDFSTSSPTLDFLDPRNLARSLSTLDPNKLQNMSFPEAVIQGTKNTVLKREWDEVVKKVRDGKNVDKSLFAIGTEKMRPMGDDTWVRLTSGQAAELEGAAMRHSVGGYARKGDYGNGGLEALMSGKAQVFSLRGPDGQPRVTIDALKLGEGKLKITQIKGRFNGMPEPQDRERVVEFLKELPVSSAPRERYYKDVFDRELPEPKTVDWAGMLGVRE